MSNPVVARLTAARLLPVAERVAAQHEIPLVTLLSVTGRVSPAQAALFQALQQPPAEVARLLGWGEAAVAKALGVPEARPTPAPKSGTRPAEAPAELPAPKGSPSALELKIEALDRRVRNLSRLGKRARQLQYDLSAARREIDALRAEVAECRAVVATVSPTAILDSVDREAERHLARFPTAVDVVRAAAVEHGVRVHEVLSGKAARSHEDQAIGRARRALIATLTTDDRFRWSQPQIAALLRLNPSSIYHWQRELGIGAAHLPGCKGEPRKAAA